MIRFCSLVCVIAITLFLPACSSTEEVISSDAPIWQDEFNYVGAPDTSKWAFDIGNWGWGNNELQAYTSLRQNSRVVDGKLIIEAHRLNPADDSFVPGAGRDSLDEGHYTSARLVTRGKQTWNRGRLEVRAKLPKGVGTWPAIWMLGEDIAEVGWPLCGEIDIMEQVGYDPDTLVATVHTQAFNHMIGNQHSSRVELKEMSEEFHTYQLDWKADSVRIGVDGTYYYTYHKPDTATRSSWPFDVEHYLLLNIAVGGNWGGHQGVDTTIWPQRMEIDWVRMYTD
ncbi:MAG: glycoside hydrolase family 16 protein [Saprospiraceae bacterium]